MKTLTLNLIVFLILGTFTVSFAGNNPALVYPAGTLSASDDSAQINRTKPWEKGALHYPASVYGKGAWYSYCPAAGITHFINVKAQVEVKLANGKRIMLCCGPCKNDVEKN